ncbi:MAG: hypothetical protein KTR24_06565 [Saprospiraceae bacterium]|nr:hypothetical protein [Saprospiraceae bacterium]
MTIEGQRELIHELESASGHRYLHTDTTYDLAHGQWMTIQNSLPKGGNIEPGLPYVDSTGQEFFFVGFWTRIINGTNASIGVEVHFPGDDFPLSAGSDAYLKLFVPPDTMTMDKLPLHNYGLTGMRSFVRTNWNQTSASHRTIDKHESHMFYVVALACHAGGPARSAVKMKGDDLFYHIAMGPHGRVEIPCGKIVVYKEDEQ